MDDTDFDLLCEELPPVEAKRLRKILAEWCNGDEDSFPVQLALLTRAQWNAAAQTPVLLKQSLELLERKLAEYRHQTATLFNNFSAVADAKVNLLEGVIADYRKTGDVILSDLRIHIANAKGLTSDIHKQLEKGAHELKKIRDDTEAERRRMEQARRDYESRHDWSDWIIFMSLLFAVLSIGVLIGWRWN